MSNFYSDKQNPLLKRLAMAIASAHGFRPEELVTDSGYSTAEMVPVWWKFQERALDTLVVLKELGLFSFEHAGNDHVE